MTSSNSWEVLWSPNNSKKFIRYNTNNVSSEIQLYNVFESKEEVLPSINKNQIVTLADNVHVCQTASRSFPENSSVKSVAWCPRESVSEHCVLAVGLSNGRVSLLNIGQETLLDTGLLLNQELAPKAERTCHELAWNAQEQNLLAVGLDKVRYYNSLLVWDVEVKASVSQSVAPVDNRASHGNIARKPLFEHGSGESTLSICWVPSMSRTLLAGQGAKWLRLLDLRSAHPKSVATTKAIFGICVDPHNPFRVASYAEGQQGAVLVWDIRQTEKPLVTIDELSPVSQISWCTTRNNLLSVLQKDSTSIKYYDLQYTSSGNAQAYSGNIAEENNHVIERSVQLPKSTKSAISSFSWHPSHDITMLTATTSGSLHYLNIFELITMSWSPSLNLMLGCGKHMLMCHKEGMHPGEVEDISYVMKRRAILGYGESSIMKDPIKLKDILQDPFLVKLWSWIRRSRKQRDHDARKTRKFYGVKSILKGELNSMGRFTKSTIDEKNKDEYVLAKRYYSNDRKLAFNMCDWDVNEAELMERLKKLVVDGEVERAAAMALFHNKLKLCIDILSGAYIKPVNSKAIDPALPIVAMALSGYSDNKQTLWAANCLKLSSQLKNAYLRAIFAFLTCEDDSFTDVLNETEMELCDRITFACSYLSDSKLLNYVESVTMNLLTNGSLEGLLLTGLNSDGIDLLENYITKTSDIQTAILIMFHAKVNEVFKDPRVVDWIENYRDLLDRWRLWHERAQFDFLVQQTDNSRKVPQQISVTCSYCNKQVSHNMMASGGVRGPRYLAGGRQNKAMSCQGCRQPLPRCSICLIHMGSFSSHAPRAGGKPKLDKVVNSFQNWFTWCQMCRHGGHAQHLKDWFVDHIECPVTGCTCCCNAQDSVSMVTPQESKPIDSSEELT